MGDYLAYARFGSYVYDGHDQITVTVDGVDVSANSSYYSTPWVHFEIVEHAPTAYTIGNEQTFARTGYKYFAFTTGNATDYILKTNNSNANFGLRLATETQYAGLNFASMTNNLNYALLTGLTPNTQYVLKISPDNWTIQDSFKFIIETFSAEFTHVYNSEIAKNVKYDGDSSSADGLIVSGVANIGPEVYVPHSIYTTNGDTSGVYTVYALAEDAFKNNTTLTTIYLPSYIYNIGSHAFAGCTNLTDIYYEWANGDWAYILFGEGVFDGCGEITVHTDNGVYYLNNETYALTIKSGEFYSYEDAVWIISQKLDITLPYNNPTYDSGSYMYDKDENVVELTLDLTNVDETKYNQFVQAFTDVLGNGIDNSNQTQNEVYWIVDELTYSIVWDKTDALSINVTTLFI